ncbi:MAG: hypothetical protein HYV97_03680 [Bdellovibrio sp.]|nr:hypothetical protein [Bdellovibrio sp.]
MNISSEMLVNAVRGVILKFENTISCKVSTQELADRANSSYTTIREIKNGVLKSMSVKKSLEISKRLGGPATLEELLKFAEIQNPKEVQDYKERFSHLLDHAIMPRAFDEFVADKEFARIIWASFGNTFITREEIRTRWGTEGEDKLNQLLLAGIVAEDNGIIKGIADKAGAGLDSAYKQFEIGYSLYKKAHHKNKENWLTFQTNSVNAAFVSRFRERLRALFQEFSKESDLPESFGNKRMFFGMIFDRYMEDLNDGKETLQ